MWGWREQHPKYSFQIILNYIEYFTNDLAANIQFFHDFFFFHERCEALKNSRGDEGGFFMGEGGREAGEQGSQGPSEGVKELANDLGRRIVWIQP